MFIVLITIKSVTFNYTSRHKFFDETKVNYTHNLNLLHVHFVISVNVIQMPFE